MSGSQSSGRPPAKPKVLKPMDSSATLPVSTIRSAHDRLRPYFCLMGHSRQPRPVEVDVVGPAVQRLESLLAAAGAAAAVDHAVGARAVPRHADEERPVVTVVCRPPVLRRGHQCLDVLLHGSEVEAVESPRRNRSPRRTGWTGAHARAAGSRSSWSGHQNLFDVGEPCENAGLEAVINKAAVAIAAHMVVILLVTLGTP
jgi:hypothetical protein